MREINLSAEAIAEVEARLRVATMMLLVMASRIRRAEAILRLVIGFTKRQRKELSEVDDEEGKWKPQNTKNPRRQRRVHREDYHDCLMRYELFTMSQWEVKR